MNALNHAITAVFDVLLWPLDQLGRGPALVIASGLFGVFALFVFKHISPQRAIRAAKERVKAHLIEIRIYQDDLRLVARAIGKVLACNLRYLGLNLLPFVPLSIPFAFVLAQFVVRYAFDPVHVHAPVARTAPHVPSDGDASSNGADGSRVSDSTSWLAGTGTTISIDLKRSAAAQVAGLTIGYSEGVRPVSPLVRVPSEGRAFQEVAVSRGGAHRIEIAFADGRRETKQLVAGDDAPRVMQPERGSGFVSALLWPAEDAFASDSPIERVAFTYPDSDMGWLPGGTGGVLIVFLVSSMLFGALAIKPLRVQI